VHWGSDPRQDRYGMVSLGHFVTMGAKVAGLWACPSFTPIRDTP